MKNFLLINKGRNSLKYMFLGMFMCIFVLFGAKGASAGTIIQDDADIITDSEESTLRGLCDKIYDKYDTSVYIWTDAGISGSDNYDYMMEQFVYSHNAGTGSNSNNQNVVILMVGMAQDDRIYEVQGYGAAEEMVNNDRCSRILDDMYNDMADGDYYDAMRIFCSKVGKYMKTAPEFDSPVFSPYVQLIACVMAAVIIMVVMAYNSGGRTTTNSRTYLDAGNSRIIGSFDRYTHTTVNRMKKPSSNSGSGGSHGGGGSHGHSSGGGRSF